METNTFSKLAEQFKRYEEGCIELDRILGTVMRTEDVDRAIGRAASILKSELRGLPYAVADRLASMQDAKEIAEFLIKEVDDALVRCSAKLKEGLDNAVALQQEG